MQIAGSDPRFTEGKDSMPKAYCLFLMLIVASLTPAMAFAQHQVVRTQQEFDRKPLRYLLYVPQQELTADSEQLPLLLFLHGGGEGGDDIENVKRHGPPKMIAQGKAFPFIVVSPQNPSSSQFWDDQQLIELLDELQEELPVDPSRIYLTGLSRGAYGAWRLAIQNPDRFAALVPVAGGAPLPYVTRLKHLPIRVFHGEEDPVIPVEESQRLVEALRAAGAVDVELTIYPDTKHDAWTAAYEHSEVFEWIQNQQRDETANVK